MFIGKVYAQIVGPSNVGSIADLVGRILPIVYGVLGVALLGYFVYGGFIWLTSAGDPDKVRKAGDTLLNAFIGTLIVVLAYLATRVVGGILGFNLYGI